MLKDGFDGLAGGASVERQRHHLARGVEGLDVLAGPFIITVAMRKCLGNSRSVCGHLSSLYLSFGLKPGISAPLPLLSAHSQARRCNNRRRRVGEAKESMKQTEGKPQRRAG